MTTLAERWQEAITMFTRRNPSSSSPSSRPKPDAPPSSAPSAPPTPAEVVEDWPAPPQPQSPQVESTPSPPEPSNIEAAATESETVTKVAHQSVAVGDLVRLAGGGPCLTVMDIIDGADDGSDLLIRCSWFDNENQLKSNSFPFRSLIEWPFVSPKFFARHPQVKST